MKLEAIERTVQKTQVWLRDIGEKLRVQDEHMSYHALRAVLHAVRDRLSVEDAAALSAQLPLLIRGVYYDGWRPHGKPLRVRKAEEFLALVDHNLAQDAERRIEPRRALDAVLGALQEHIDPGEFDKLFRSLPEELQSLFAPSISRRAEL